MDEHFSYWKRPRLRWLWAGVALMQLGLLWHNVQEYLWVRDAGIFSAEAWQEYAADVWLRCALNGLCAALFGGVLLVGALARSRRAARWGERALLLGIALAWGVTGLLSPPGNEPVWGVLFVLLLLGVGALCVRRAWEQDS